MPSVAEGEVEPIPTFPLASTGSAVEVAEAVEVETTKSGTLESAAVEVAEMEKIPNGEVEPRPSLPAELVSVDVATPVPKYRLPWLIETATEVVGARERIP